MSHYLITQMRQQLSAVANKLKDAEKKINKLEATLAESYKQLEKTNTVASDAINALKEKLHLKTEDARMSKIRLGKAEKANRALRGVPDDTDNSP